MTQGQMTKDNWVALFREAGLDDGMMHRWHEAFERRFPDAHQRFLEWLAIPAPEIERIRASSRTGFTKP